MRESLPLDMKRFLSRRGSGDLRDLRESPEVERTSLSTIKSATSEAGESLDSIRELPVFFESNHDTTLDLNPSISNTKLVPSIESEARSKSVFSRSKASFSTKQSSVQSLQLKGSYSVEYGQPLQISIIGEDNTAKNVVSFEERLTDLAHDIVYAANQYSNSQVTLTAAVMNCIDRFKSFLVFANEYRLAGHGYYNYNTFNNDDVRKILRVFLDFYDNLLNDDVYIKLRLLLTKRINEFAAILKSGSGSDLTTLLKPQNFSVDAYEGQTLPNALVLSNIIDRIANSALLLKEQNGSFIAPITRGLSKEFSILCLYFGYPSPTDHHFKLTQSIRDLYDDIHVMVVKNRIDVASVSLHRAAPIPAGPSSPPLNPQVLQKFKLPFRVPNEKNIQPMSLSLSVENSPRTSGTMGGFIYPIIDVKKQPHLESYTRAKFALSCGHVCLNNFENNMDYPYVSSPSSVLISLYKQALYGQYVKASLATNDSSMAEAKVAYGAVLKQLDVIFPPKRVKNFVTNPKQKQPEYEYRNLPVHRFGQIIWGERNLIKVKESNQKRLSDLAIIKVNKHLNCEQNYLGDDIAFNEFDPALMFDNMYVRAVVNLQRAAKPMNLNIDEVDSVSEASTDGLQVFKYGSTTKFTKGTLNGIKLVYWLDGAIHSSEFVINSTENNTAFAAGGDSGAWILTKLEDCETVSENKGLGVVGMLHSYDGEYKQFGLFTPMNEILLRLEEVTSIKWGVVGVPEKDVYRYESENNTEGEMDSDSESEDEVSTPFDVD